MLTSIEVRVVDAERVEVVATAPHAAVTQDGSRRQPARPFMGVATDRQAELRDAVGRHLDALVLGV